MKNYKQIKYKDMDERKFLVIPTEGKFEWMNSLSGSAIILLFLLANLADDWNYVTTSPLLKKQFAKRLGIKLRQLHNIIKSLEKVNAIKLVSTYDVYINPECIFTGSGVGIVECTSFYKGLKGRVEL